jgi:hypothetical protein
VPAWQETHIPDRQTRLAPQGVPSESEVIASLQTAPLALHDWVPMWQGLLGTQLVPALHATHVPPKHTFPLPHIVPSGWLAESMHTETPVAQEVVPTLQGVADWQAWPALQPPQVPLLHTLSVPQPIPLGTTPPASVQLTEGAQDVLPV